MQLADLPTIQPYDQLCTSLTPMRESHDNRERMLPQQGKAISSGAARHTYLFCKSFGQILVETAFMKSRKRSPPSLMMSSANSAASIKTSIS